MEEKQRNNEKNNKKQIVLIAVLVVLMIALAVMIYFATSNSDEADERKISYTELIDEINAGNVEKIEMTVGSTSIKVKLKDVEE